MPGFIDLALACPRGSDFYPGNKLARLMGQILRRQPGMVSTYALPPGSERLRVQIARRSLELGMALQAENIILTNGCMEALQLALRAVTKPGDAVGLESPTYFNLLPLFASLGLKAVEIPTDPQHGCRWMRWSCCCPKAASARWWPCPMCTIRWAAACRWKPRNGWRGW
jgi:DNA-binding transcriptional MocR family regulator